MVNGKLLFVDKVQVRGFLIDPQNKIVLAIEVNTNSIATFLGCENFEISKVFENGDMLYCDSTAKSLCQYPYTFNDLGVFYGKSVFVSTEPTGVFKNSSLSTIDLFNQIMFQEDPSVSWFKFFLKDDNIEMTDMIKRKDGRMISIQSVIDLIPLLPEQKKNELKMLAVIDSANTISKMNLITHLANAIELA